MARLPYVDPAMAPEHVRRTLERLPSSLNVFRMMAHASANLRPLVRLGASILGEQKLSGKLRELAILRIAQLSAASYEWLQHIPLAQQMGVSQVQMDAVERGDIEAACFAPDERLVLRFTTEVVRDVRASDDVFAALARRFTAQEIVELILAIGFYMTIARLVETTAVDPEPAGERLFGAHS